MSCNDHYVKHLDVITHLSEQLKARNPGFPISIVLIGSAARGTETSFSDIDLLILSDQVATVPDKRGQFHIHVKSVPEFLQKLREGDDFTAWCTRYGILVQDAGHWRKITEAPEAGIWPDWSKKITHGIRRLLLATTLLETGDKDAASEEALYAAGHVSRALLLRSGVFPLSRPELPFQMRTAGYSHLASNLEDLLHGETGVNLIKRTLGYCKKLLCHPDKDAYRRLATELTQGSEKKSHKHNLRTRAIDRQSRLSNRPSR